MQEQPLENKPRTKDLIYRDISRCSDILCSKSNICSRFKQLEIDQKNGETLTSVNDFNGRDKDGLCDYFIELKI
jgi:hypothetical protein